jgi:hypothetical protein
MPIPEEKADRTMREYGFPELLRQRQVWYLGQQQNQQNRCQAACREDLEQRMFAGSAGHRGDRGMMVM